MKAFCMSCRDYTEVDIQNVKREKQVNNRTMKYRGYDPHCYDCGDQVFHPRVHDMEMVNLQEALDIWYEEEKRRK